MMRMFFFLLLPLLFTACSGAENNKDSASSTQVTITLADMMATGALQGANNVPSNVQSMAVQAFSAAGTALFPPVIANRPNFTITLNVPNASNVRFIVLAFDGPNGQGKNIYAGQNIVNLQGAALTVPIVMNLAIVVQSIDNIVVVPRNASLTFSALVGGVSPTSSSPILWSASAGVFSNNVWTAPDTLGNQRITAQIDATVNTDQNPNIVGTLDINVINRAPVVSMQSNSITAAIGGTTSATLSLSDPDADGVSPQFTPNLPAWITYSPASKSLSISPDLTSPSTFSMSIVAIDSLGLSGDAISLTISTTNSNWDQFNWDAGKWN
ncbi:MAG: hypothetical protein Q9M19_03120 [Mariprofundaceae bacterium]|nr:hypothetical protein [Mariprofundaceae bacterium]